MKATRTGLTTAEGASLYIGALLGPSLLLVPGLAAAAAGPASMLAWVFMLVLSALLAVVFTVFGRSSSSSRGVSEYAAAAFGPLVGRMTAWCFLAGVVTGAPVVCLIGGNYVAELLGTGGPTALIAAALLLAVVLSVTAAGVRTSARVQLLLVGLLLLLVLVATIGAAPSVSGSNWTPFAPHGPLSIGRAASTLMLCFVGWEAIASLTSRLADARRQLPAVVGIAFATTTVIYLALAAVTVGALGAGAGGAVPLAALLRFPLQDAAPIVAAGGAVVVTLAATNAYITGGTALAAELTPAPVSAAPRARTTRSIVPAGIVAAGIALFGAVALGVIDLDDVVAIPTTLFLAVYLFCTAAGARNFRGRSRVVAVAAFCAVALVAAFSGWALLAPVGVAASVALHAVIGARR